MNGYVKAVEAKRLSRGTLRRLAEKRTMLERVSATSFTKRRAADPTALEAVFWKFPMPVVKLLTMRAETLSELIHPARKNRIRIM